MFQFFSAAKLFRQTLSLSKYSRNNSITSQILRFKSSSTNSGPAKYNRSKLFIVVFALAGCWLFFSLFSNDEANFGKPVSYQDFLNLLEIGEVEKINLINQSSKAEVFLHTGSIISVTLPSTPKLFIEEVRLLETKWGIPENDRIPISIHNAMSLVDIWSQLAVYFIVLFMLLSLFKFGADRVAKHLKINHQSFMMMKGSDIKSKFYSNQKQSETNTTNTTTTNNNINNDKSNNMNADFKPLKNIPFHWDPLSGFNQIQAVTTNVRFKDVAGMHASKEEVMEFVSYLKNPEKYQNLGAKLPKGALLLGPPGTGKTLLVKAVANEANVPFFTMAGSEFVEVIGGLGASRMRRLFQAARSQQQAIIFIDELDSIGRRRSTGSSDGIFGKKSNGSGGGGSSTESEQTLNQLLVEMDGMSTSEGVIVFGATNRGDLLDRALLRAGRFDRHILIDLPNLAERKELFAMYVAKYTLAADILLEDLVDRLSNWTPGMSGADIFQLCNEASLIAARREDYNLGVTKLDFEKAFERILVGSAKQSNPLSLAERRTVAVQESGRALIAWLTPRSGLLPTKISIIPRTSSSMDTTVGGALGFTQFVSEEKRMYNNVELADRMALLLGGRAAEQVMFNSVSDASVKFLKEANSLALKQVREFGMSELIGNLSFGSVDSEFNMKPYSQRTQSMVELEAKRLVSFAFQKCIQMLNDNKDKLELLIDALLKREELNYDEIIQLLGPTAAHAQAKPITRL